MRLRDLRHRCGTLFLSRGFNAKSVQKFLDYTVVGIWCDPDRGSQ
jgi:hypothetical protein